MKTSVASLTFCAALLTSSCLPGQPADVLREVTILYTNDEHGWMEGMTSGQGAANLYQLWQEQEGFTEDGPFLVLSGGDNFTGPAISTWVQGESMVDLMNAMDYDASAVGNHEFDFGLEELARRTREADYPYLGANIRWRASGENPVDLGILPYTIVQVNDLDIGIIGLTTTSTPYVTNPQYVKDLEFTAYESALRQTVAGIDPNAVDLLFVVSHVCMDELDTLIRSVTDLNIALAGGGHCNELVAKQIEDTVILGGGFHFTAYARAAFIYDLEKEKIVSTDFATATNRNGAASPTINAVVNKWADTASDALQEVVAFNATEVKRGEGLEQVIIDSWLASYPDADIAFNNMGGVRANLPAGNITLSDLVTILPFENTIISVDVPGRVVAQALREGGRPVVAGLQRRGNQWIVNRTGDALDANKQYTVLLNSFMYAGGDNFSVIAQADPQGYDTGIHYRDPFYDWLKNQGTSRNNPLRF